MLKRLKFILLALVVVLQLVFPSASVAQVTISTDSLEVNNVCSVPTAAEFCKQWITITNPTSVITELQYTVKFSSPDGANVYFGDVVWMNGVLGLFDSDPFVNFEQTSGETIVTIFLTTSTPGTGIPVSSMPVSYFKIVWLTEHTAGGKTICIDSTVSSSQGAWTVLPAQTINWSGQRCDIIRETLPILLNLTNCPSETYNLGSFCQEAEYDFDAISGEGDAFQFDLLSGPGVIDPYSGVWTFQPSAEQAGELFNLSIGLLANVCGDGYILVDECIARFSFNENQPPSFTPGQPVGYVAESGIPLEINLQVDDADECTAYEFIAYGHSQDPQPPGTIDSLGTYTYLGTSADTGTYYIYAIVSEAGSADTIGFYLYHYENHICGDVNHSTEVNISDVTAMISYLFGGGVAPRPMAAGDVNCSGTGNISDVTYMTAWLFGIPNGPEPCLNCPQ